jgi:hypothetical protein
MSALDGRLSLALTQERVIRQCAVQLVEVDSDHPHGAVIANKEMSRDTDTHGPLGGLHLFLVDFQPVAPGWKLPNVAIESKWMLKLDCGHRRAHK